MSNTILYNKVYRWAGIVLPFCLFSLLPLNASAQIGEYRNELAIGINGGYVMSNVGFQPEVTQSMLGGMTLGATVRYTCEKYFSCVCALVGEINYTQTGWKENIQDFYGSPVVNAETGLAETFERQLTYIQVPVMARIGWGRERKGVQFFIQLGPQMGFYMSDKVKSNFNRASRNIDDRVGTLKEAVMDSLPVQRKFDYGIVGGLGLEFSHPKVGHFIVEGRYYYGLGDFFNNSKRDYFGRSNLSNIVVKMTYLFDIKKSKNNKIK